VNSPENEKGKQKKEKKGFKGKGRKDKKWRREGRGKGGRVEKMEGNTMQVIDRNDSKIATYILH